MYNIHVRLMNPER